MSTFVIGTNRFVDCATLIAHRGKPVLVIDITTPTPMVDLRMPEGASHLVVEHNQLKEGLADVIESQGVMSMISADTLVLHVARLDGHALVHVDFRPLGVAIYTDALGLHVGTNVLSGNQVVGARIAIGIT